MLSQSVHQECYATLGHMHLKGKNNCSNLFLFTTVVRLHHYINYIYLFHAIWKGSCKVQTECR